MLPIPEGTVEVTDFSERIQEGDLIYDDEDEEFLPATRWHVGEFAHQYPCVVRPDVAKARRVRRTRQPTR